MTGNKKPGGLSWPRVPLRILLVGERGSGKTTIFLRAVRRLEEKGIRCGGAVCTKMLDVEGKVIGIEVSDLSGESPGPRLLARTDRVLDGPETGKYRFSFQGLDFGRNVLKRGAMYADVLFADELGPLEMRGQGFHNLFGLAEDPATPPMAIAVRPSLAEEVSRRMQPLPITVVEVTPSRRREALEDLVRILMGGVSYRKQQFYK